MKYLLTILLFIFISCTSKIRVKRVIDGDTLITSTNERIRLAQIDAPESKQFYGVQAKQFLSAMVLNKTIELKREGKGHYGRTIGKLYVDRHYINKIMIDSGMAWAYKRYSPLHKYELDARRNHIGLWKYSNPVPPFIYRQRH